MSRHIPLAHDQVRQQQQAGAPAPDDFGRYVASTEAEFITELARDAVPSAPCQWGGGNDCITCLTCGAEYDYRSQERPDCLQGQPSCAPGRVEEAEITAVLECLGRREPNDPRERIRRALEASRRLATPSPQEPAPAAEFEAVVLLRTLTRAAYDMIVGIGVHNRLHADAPARKEDIQGPVVASLQDAYATARNWLEEPRPSSRDEPDTALREVASSELRDAYKAFNDLGFMLRGRGGHTFHIDAGKKAILSYVRKELSALARSPEREADTALRITVVAFLGALDRGYFGSDISRVDLRDTAFLNMLRESVR